MHRMRWYPLAGQVVDLHTQVPPSGRRRYLRSRGSRERPSVRLLVVGDLVALGRQPRPGARGLSTLAPHATAVNLQVVPKVLRTGHREQGSGWQRPG